MSAREGDLSQLGDCLCGEAGLCTALSLRSGSGRFTEAGVRAASRVLLPTVRCVAVVAPATCGGELLTEAQKHDGLETATRRFRSIGPIRAARADRFDADTAPVPYQATALDLQRVWDRDLQQRRASLGPAESCNARRSRSSIRGLNRNSQSRSEESVQGRGHRGRGQARTVPGVLRHALAGQGHPAGDGASDPGAARLPAITLIVWKKGARFDAQHLKPQTA